MKKCKFEILMLPIASLFGDKIGAVAPNLDKILQKFRRRLCLSRTFDEIIMSANLIEFAIAPKYFTDTVGSKKVKDL